MWRRVLFVRRSKRVVGEVGVGEEVLWPMRRVVVMWLWRGGVSRVVPKLMRSWVVMDRNVVELVIMTLLRGGPSL